MPSVPFYSLEVAHAEIQAEVEAALKSVFTSNRFVLGKEVAAFESEFAAYSGVKYCLGVANGLDALFVSLKMLGIGVGDEVIVPAHTYIATWLAISRTGATIVPVDVNADTMLCEPTTIRGAITGNSKAILPVHLYGQGCEMEEIMSLAEEFDLKVIEDNAQAQGSSLGDRKTGSFGQCNATSFYPSKNLGCLGDGGAITTDDEQVYNAARMFCNYGSKVRFENPVQGINSRLDEIQAAVLRIKLRKLDMWNDAKRQTAISYHERLKTQSEIKQPTLKEGSAPHLYSIRAADRGKLIEFLSRKGVETSIHYPKPPHLQQAFSWMGFEAGSFPISESIAKTTLSLPIWPGMKESEVEYVCNSIKQFYS